MVGTRTSKGCDTCRKRKIKCRQERPECSACVLSGWKCPGYIRSWRFVSENDRVLQFYRKRNFIYDPNSDGLENWALEIAHWESTGVGSQFNTIIPRLLMNSVDRHAGLFVSIFTDSAAQSILSPQAVDGLFPFIPPRLGQSAALDIAISSLCGIYRDLRISTKLSVLTTQTYDRCLSALQMAIADPVLRLSSETICACLVVEVCEVILNENCGRYGELVRGSRFLIEAAGPERFRSGLDRAMLELQRAPFIALDIADERPSFLLQPCWRALNERPSNFPNTEVSGIRLRSQLCDFLVELPGIIARSRQLIGETDLKNRTALDAVMVQVMDLNHRLEIWYEEELHPQVHAHIADDSSKSKHLHDGKDIRLVFTFLNCITCSLLVRLYDLVTEIRDALEVSEEFATSPRDANVYRLRREVARSTYLQVQKRSLVTARQLSFGLSNLGYSNSSEGLRE
ncbi:hypothetical protein BX600DRAFT_252560 [Xylariales sp. PMI_506]|nr:hypothetical protein BX600DRAFT_252560 [Xylariales sp. PMI_506]